MDTKQLHHRRRPDENSCGSIGRGWVLLSGARPVLAAAVCLVFVALLAGCDVRHVDWRNAAYTVTCPGMLTRPTTVQLVSGHGTGSWPGGPLYVTLATNMTADVTGDGRADQVLLLGCASVGSAYATEVQVFADGPTLLARLAAPPLVPSAYFHPQFTRVWVVGGQLHTIAEYWASTDCHFCASTHLSITWRWTGHGFAVAHWDRL